MDLEEENRRRIKQFYNQKIQKAFRDNLHNTAYCFPKKSSSPNTISSRLSLPSHRSHDYDLHSQNISHKQPSLTNNKESSTKNLLRMKGKTKRGISSEKKIKLLLSEKNRIQMDENENQVISSKLKGCCINIFVKSSPAEKQKQRSRMRMMERESKHEYGQRIIKRIVGSERGKKSGCTSEIGKK